MPRPNIVAVVLTFNAESSIEAVLQACQPLASRILVVDSFSTDKTAAIVESMGCTLVTHPFENYSQQRNWAQETAQIATGDWVLHVDADEVISPELAHHIEEALSGDLSDVDGFLFQRLSYFLGSPIRYGHINPSWHLRLYRPEKGGCEHRLYDQHFIVHGKTRKLKGLLLDLQLTTLETWTAAHNRWSTAEAKEVLAHLYGGAKDDSETLPSSLSGDIRMKKRWLKNNIWYRAPLLVRPLLFFFYSYFLRLGFLDGKAGLIYHILQSFWFRFLVDAKIYETLLPAEAKIPAAIRTADSKQKLEGDRTPISR